MQKCFYPIFKSEFFKTSHVLEISELLVYFIIHDANIKKVLCDFIFKLAVVDL